MCQWTDKYSRSMQYAHKIHTCRPLESLGSSPLHKPTLLYHWWVPLGRTSSLKETLSFVSEDHIEVGILQQLLRRKDSHDVNSVFIKVIFLTQHEIIQRVGPGPDGKYLQTPNIGQFTVFSVVHSLTSKERETFLDRVTFTQCECPTERNSSTHQQLQCIHFSEWG